MPNEASLAPTREAETEEQNRVLTRIHALAVRLASLPAEADLPALLAEELQSATGAAAVTFGLYREEDRCIVMKSLRTDSALLDRFVAATGIRPMELLSRVDEASHAEMLKGGVAYRDSLREVTFGMVSPLVSAAVSRIFGIGTFLGVSYVYEGRVYGTSVLIFRKDAPLPREDYLTAFSALAAVSLRRRVAEEEIRRLNEGLEGMVEERTSRLVELNRRLEESNADLERTLRELREAQARLVLSEKMATLGQLMAGIAHELNTPMGAILSSARTALDGLDSALLESLRYYRGLPEELLSRFEELFLRAARRPLGELAASTREARAERRRAAALLEAEGIGEAPLLAETLSDLGALEGLEGLLSLLREPAGRELLRRARSLAAFGRSLAVIEASAVKAAKVVEALRLYARNDSSEAPSPVDLSESLETVLTLYYNKIKLGVELRRDFAPGARVLGRAEELEQVWVNLINNALQAMDYRGSLEIGVRRAGRELEVRVVDDGPGIPAELQPRVFEPFFTTKAAGEGTGLGLDIARKIVENHRGRISFESRPGRTAFTVRLPEAGAAER